jgi:hypothetical protein
MRVRLPHAPYVARKIALDLLDNPYIKINNGIESITMIGAELIEDDIKKEMALEAKVKLLLEDSEDEIEYSNVDFKQVFWMAKKRLANEFDVILNYEDRYNNLSHMILDALWQEDELTYDVSEGIVKHVILDAMLSYIKGYEEIEDIVLERMDNYKRKLVPGSEDYELVYKRLYEAELKNRGMF